MTNPNEQAEIRRSAQEAKEYLIAQIVQQAEQENVPLSDVERKMLYFTELVETLPDIWDVSDQFDKEYDREEYEAKISSLLRNARIRVGKESPDGAQRWWQAERDLRKEDHYLGVMVSESHLSHQSTGDFWPIMKWAGITMVVGTVALYLDAKGLLPNWIKNLSPRAWLLGILVFFLLVIFLQDLTLQNVRLIFKRRFRK
jgi:hypothetical protein